MSEQLSEDELKHLRELMVADKRRQWLVSGIRQVALWVAGVVAGYVALKNMVAEVVTKAVL